MVASTGLILAAGRFGLAPSANRLASAGAYALSVPFSRPRRAAPPHAARNRLTTSGLKLTEKPQGQLSGDPAGYTASGAPPHPSCHLHPCA